MSFKSESPFVGVSLSELGGDHSAYAVDLFSAFEAYVKALDTIVRENMPDLLKKT